MITLIRFGFKSQGQEAYRVHEDGNDIGTISRHCPKCKWQAWTGIGPGCKFVGTFEAKQHAVDAATIGIRVLGS